MARGRPATQSGGCVLAVETNGGLSPFGSAAIVSGVALAGERTGDPTAPWRAACRFRSPARLTWGPEHERDAAEASDRRAVGGEAGAFLELVALVRWPGFFAGFASFAERSVRAMERKRRRERNGAGRVAQQKLAMPAPTGPRQGSSFSRCEARPSELASARRVKRWTHGAAGKSGLVVGGGVGRRVRRLTSAATFCWGGALGEIALPWAALGGRRTSSA